MNKFWWTVYGIVVAVAIAIVVIPKAFGGEFHFGVGVDTNPTAKDVGLPFYPGARPHKKDKDEDSAAKIWGSFGFFGLKVVAVELDSRDAPGKVASFYRNALGKYGPVLDCSAGQPHPPVAPENSKRLDCHDDKAGPGEFLFKAGIKTHFHLVAVEPEPYGSKIALVYIQMRGID